MEVPSFLILTLIFKSYILNAYIVVNGSYNNKMKLNSIIYSYISLTRIINVFILYINVYIQYKLCKGSSTYEYNYF
ncbi:hypothetical protein CPAST_c04580 [Clostridium pasteurianum DSM 525 = ATCC 6013]|uniref:Uncharacterized protein n=1 Tax=Clostridium pasteurianum DSM 525 = ATCC 6013 TaxID=1262449 RepID=A0A0H3J3S1_CLOPA|nr:hypothetical protein CPAST_c04580 [Clostridium pasteurianum DSM 525 = ATCC 6013]AOZ77779.1 hypothetical protein AQ984_02220 [Clostridium pasteurianum]AJA50546.1 hypothetical protein CLPA_c04580 [Clostridium pasteurianum DSM 525 = ATCC 6013]AOZ73982.1 hypothetical protein AQ983_02220 [Clostridium pasteurianum DSM 525 = ATCC 6013]ELP61130.1 hypothetical protein F502_01705 [Clostridium pasteurianum DSM 525 = ATCC 6013]